MLHGLSQLIHSFSLALSAIATRSQSRPTRFPWLRPKMPVDAT
jgi:hypothetical protein